MFGLRISPGLYRTVWRWHFYAGIAVAPFLVILAVTGAIYLFNDEINDWLHRDLRIVPAASQSVPLSAIAAAALASQGGGTVTRIDTPRGPGRSAEVFVRLRAPEPVRVFVDPGNGRVLGSYTYSRTLVGFADLAHGSLMLGKGGDAIVELVACWGFILVATGLFLWWPRGRKRLAGILYPRWSKSGRPFWKDLHAVIGFWASLVVMFLILTGLPWAGIWGDLLRRGTDLAGIGYPASHRLHGTPAPTTVGAESGKAAPWTLEQAPAPQSDPHAHHGGAAMAPQAEPAHRLGLDAVAAILQAEGMDAPYRLTLPRGDRSAFTAFTYPDQPETQRTLHIDQYSGRVIADIRFADYGWAAKAVELGVQIHMGNYFGRANQLLMLLACLATVLLAVTGPLMWWMRRPKGTFSAPQITEPLRARQLAMIVMILCVVFPLAGASLLVVLGIEYAFTRASPAVA